MAVFLRMGIYGTAGAVHVLPSQNWRLMIRDTKGGGIITCAPTCCVVVVTMPRQHLPAARQDFPAAHVKKLTPPPAFSVSKDSRTSFGLPLLWANEPFDGFRCSFNSFAKQQAAFARWFQQEYPSHSWGSSTPSLVERPKLRADITAMSFT